MPDNTTTHPSAETPFSDIEEIIADIAAGRMVVMVDDENRENEGDLIMAAEGLWPEEDPPALGGHLGAHLGHRLQLRRALGDLGFAQEPAAGLQVTGGIGVEQFQGDESRERGLPGEEDLAATARAERRDDLRHRGLARRSAGGAADAGDLRLGDVARRRLPVATSPGRWQDRGTPREAP